MNCACIKNDFRFTIDCLDDTSVVYRDISTWMEGFNYNKDSNYELQIKFPGHSKPKKFTVNNFENVKLDFGKIIDGIYEITVDNCGTLYTRCEALIPNLQCCVDKINAENKNPDKTSELNGNLEMFKACVKSGDLESSNELLKIIKRTVKNLNCNCECT